MEKRFKWAIIVICVCLVLLIACGAALFIHLNGQKTETAAGQGRAIELAEEYLRNGNIEQAILAFWDAIDEDSGNADLYSQLADLYEQQGDRDMFIAVLRLGAKNTGIRELIDRLAVEEGTTAPENDSEEEKVIDGNPVLNEFLLKVFGGNDHGDYIRGYGSPTSSRSGSAYVVTYGSLDASVYYVDNGSNTVVDPGMGEPYTTSMPSYISLGRISDLFSGMGDILSFEQLKGMSVAGLTVQTDSEHGYVVSFEKAGCRVTIESTENGDIVSDMVWNEIVPLHGGGESGYTLTGMVINAVTGEPTYGAQVSIWAGSRAAGLPMMTASTASGSYTFTGLDVGTYTLEVEQSGYITEEFTVEIVSGEVVTVEDLVVSPELDDGEVRIVLTWGAYPSDLDSYVFGTTDSGSSFRLFFGDMNITIGGRQIASLDVDDMTGYGPETTTLYTTNGVFDFVVSDFLTTGTMATSGATVKIYMPGQSTPTVVNMSGSVVDDWYVCTIDHGELIIRNTAYSADHGSTVKGDDFF